MEEDTQELFNAVQHGNLEEIQKCLDKGISLNSQKAGNNSLHLAVYSHGQQFGANSLVQFLLDKGIDANLGNDRGNTALHIATRKNFPSILKILLGFCVEK